MQLLAELEEQPRGVYTGAIGFFSRERTVFNVAIRTLELEGDRGTMGVGSGIVIDSHAAEEYRRMRTEGGVFDAGRSRTSRGVLSGRNDAMGGEYPLSSCISTG